MFSKIALLSAAGLVAIAASVNSYMGTFSQGSCCQKMVATSGGSCSTATNCFPTDSAATVTGTSPCECASCVCSSCLPEDCCCEDCCADGACCDGAACDRCGENAAKLVSSSTADEPCSGSCCAKK